MTETHTYQLTGYSPAPGTATVTIRSFEKPERVRRAIKGLATFWGAARCGVPALPTPAADLLEPEAGGQVQMIGREVTGLVTRLELPELEPKDERSRRTPFDVPLAHEVAEPAVWRDVSVFRVVDSTA